MLKEILEPSFYQEIKPNLEEVKNGFDNYEARFCIEKFKEHHTEFFLYNVDNFMLLGVNNKNSENQISLNRTLNGPRENYEI